MPNFKGHMLGGLVAYGCITFFTGSQHSALSTHAIGLSATLAGALFPDVDIKSKGQRLYMKVLALILIMSIFLQAYIPLVFVLALFFSSLILPHRGPFHDLWFITAVLALVDIGLMVALPHRRLEIAMMSLFFLAGVISHLLLDKGLKKTFR